MSFEKLKAEGKDLEFGVRADYAHFTPDDEKRFWRGDENVIYDKERKCIEVHLIKTAEEIKDQCVKENKRYIKEEEIESTYNNIESKIKDVYCNLDSLSWIHKYERFIEDTRIKNYSLGLTFFILLIISIVIEFVVLIFQSVGMVLTESEEYMVIDIPVIVIAAFYAVLLAIGGFLLGKGMGRFFISKKFEKIGIAHPERTYKIQLLDYFYIVIGILLIIAISIIRMIAGGGLQVFIITLLLGLVVAVFKSQHEYYKFMRSKVGNLRLHYFCKKASHKHLRSLNDYKQKFINKLKELAKDNNIQIITQGEKEKSNQQEVVS